ncbi:glycosyltransferase family 34 protein [Acidomyces richmondensis BFW]|nr:glycosyltransferase family 34 protein [Acidomyces richmondensis BFW]
MFFHSLYGLSLWSQSKISPNIAETTTTTVHDGTSSLTQSAQEAPLESGHVICPIIKLSMLYGSHNFPQLQAAVDLHHQHCERWGCRFKCLPRALTSRKLYSKPYFLLLTMLDELSKSIEERHEWLMWVDADSIIVNPAISPCTFLPPRELENVFALVTADHHGLNNGIFYLRVHQSSLDLLTQIVDYPMAHPDVDLGWSADQAAMERVIKSIEMDLRDQNKAPGIAWVPREWFNTFEFEHGFEGQPGHFIVHFAGLGETRISHMAQWLNVLQRNEQEWEIPPEHTFYAHDIPRFWNGFVANASTRLG